MEGGEFEWLVGEVDARAELIGVDVLPHLIEAQPGIDREIVRDLPLVLRIDAREPTKLGDVVGDRLRSIDGDAAGSRLDERLIADIGLLAADGESGAQRVRLVDHV